MVAAAAPSSSERAPLLGVVDGHTDDDVEAARPNRRGSCTAARWVDRKPEPHVGAARLLGRGGVLGQSPGAWDIEHNWGSSSAWCACLDRAETIWDSGRRVLYRTDPFHSVVRYTRRCPLTAGTVLGDPTVCAAPPPVVYAGEPLDVEDPGHRERGVRRHLRCVRGGLLVRPNPAAGQTSRRRLMLAAHLTACGCAARLWIQGDGALA